MTKVLRTPKDRFTDLAGFPYESLYIEGLKNFEGLRMHYIDEGPQDAHHVFLCLHGEPTWSYLYRKMVPIFTEASHRVVAPDFFGFGRSDKPLDENIYTFDFHREALIAFIEYLDLKNITLVCQDWGGILGLTLPMDMTDRFSRMLIMKRSCPHLSEKEVAAYDAPFPDIQYKAGVQRFPEIVPDRPDSPGAELSRRAREWLRSKWTGQVFMAIGMKDPVLGPPVMQTLRNNIKNCPEPYEHPEAGHFVQEWGEEIARKALIVFDG